MAQKASWGPKSFETTPRSIRPFKGFATSVTLKEDSENDTSGTPPTNTRGRELQPLNFETFCVRAAGVDPMTEFNSWCSLVGQAYPFYLGGVKLGPAESFKLKSVGVAETEHAEDGTVICMKISLAFVEQSEGKTSKLESTGTRTSTGTGSGIGSASGAGMGAVAGANSVGADDARAELFGVKKEQALAKQEQAAARQQALAATAEKEERKQRMQETAEAWSNANLVEKFFLAPDLFPQVMSDRFYIKTH